MKKRNYFFIGVLLLAAANLPAIEASRLHLKIVGTKEAASPHIFDDSVFFSYKPAHSVRYAGIAFAHENFREVHLFQRNEHNILFFLYPIPEGLRALEYRLVVDGLWTTDPANSLKYRDASGVSVSRFEFPASASKPPAKSPLRRGDGTVEFTVEAPRDKTIFLAGSFNGWDPYMYRFSEASPGLYTLTLRLLPGRYSYVIYSEGRRVPDPLNPNRGHDRDGYEVSLLEIPG